MPLRASAAALPLGVTDQRFAYIAPGWVKPCRPVVESKQRSPRSNRLPAERRRPDRSGLSRHANRLESSAKEPLMKGWGRKESATIGSDVKPTAGEGREPLYTDGRIHPVKCLTRRRVRADKPLNALYQAYQRSQSDFGLKTGEKVPRRIGRPDGAWPPSTPARTNRRKSLSIKMLASTFRTKRALGLPIPIDSTNRRRK